MADITTPVTPVNKVWVFTVGDRLTALSAQLVDANGDPIDLEGQTVVFRMVSKTGEIKISDQAAVVDDATTGKVHYEWKAIDVDTAGKYFGWFIRSTGATKETHPSGGRKYAIQFITAA